MAASPGPLVNAPLSTFPRFGLTQFAKRFPKSPDSKTLSIAGDVETTITISEELSDLPRVEQVSDFHCVTTWSVLSLRWSGYRFSDFFEQLVLPHANPDPDANFVVFRSQDGYRADLLLEDLLAADVLIADTLNGASLSIEHGAPLRLVAPAHYGYKSPKHIRRIEFWRDERDFRPPGFRFMNHPRARVAFEERGRGIPGPLLRYLYRPLIKRTAKRFRQEMESRNATASSNNGKEE